jgi:ATP-binding cassette, subfamily F, member 3
MLVVDNLSVRVAGRLLLDSASAQLPEGARVGLVGRNGIGKTTLFKVITGELSAEGGSIALPKRARIGRLAQEAPAGPETLLDVVLAADSERASLLAEAETEHDAHRIAEIQTRLSDIAAHAAPARAAATLAGLGFSPADQARPCSEFSGGWRMRVALAAELFSQPDLLLLDEPTNYLDLEGTLWLEAHLARYPRTVIVISHDRDLLDNAVDWILHLEDGKLALYRGGYTSFARQRAERQAQNAKLAKKQQQQQQHLQAFVDRFRAKATKARQAQSRMKMLAKMEELAPLHVAAPFSFEFRDPLRAPNPLLVLEDLKAGYGDKVVLEAISLSLQSEQRIGLLGINGAGKSTFIKTVAGVLAPLAGQMTVNKGLAIGYFAQHQVEMLRDDQSALWHLARLAPDTREQELRDYLGGFNFPGDMATSTIEQFSGGEKARLALALIVWQRPNLLLLDEPTNHLDLETREALTVALAQFEGTLVLVSHDRHLLRATTEQLLIVADGAVKPFDGDLDDYRDSLLNREAKPAPSKPKPVKDKPAVSRKPLEARIKRLEELMARLGARKTDIEARLGDPALYAEERKDDLGKLLLDQAYVGKELAQLEAEWLEKQAELEAGAP